MVSPVNPEIKQQVISAYLAGHGRNKNDRLLHEQGVKVSHGSISNIINAYKRQQEQSSEQPTSIREQAAAVTSPSPVIGEEVDNINANTVDQDIDFQDQAY